MNNFSTKTKKMTTNGKISNDERENKRLREVLQKAVNAEKAPEILCERIRRMVRE